MQFRYLAILAAVVMGVVAAPADVIAEDIAVRGDDIEAPVEDFADELDKRVVTQGVRARVPWQFQVHKANSSPFPYSRAKFTRGALAGMAHASSGPTASIGRARLTMWYA